MNRLIKEARISGQSLVLGLHRPRTGHLPSVADGTSARTVVPPTPQVGRRDPVPAGKHVPTVTPASAAAADPVKPPVTDAAQLQALRTQARDEARKEGLALGRKEGQQQVLSSNEAQMQKLAGILEAIPAALNRALAQMDEQIADIAFAAICKILGEAMADRVVAVSAVSEVVGHVKSARRICIALAPADHEFLSSRADLQACLPTDAAIELESDSSVQLGGCIVRTDHGEWDGRVETQLKLLHQTLRTVQQAQTEAA